MKASKHTPNENVAVQNTEPAEDISQIPGQDFCVYRHQIATKELREEGSVRQNKENTEIRIKKERFLAKYFLEHGLIRYTF